MIMGVIAGNTQHGGRTNRGYAESWTSEQLDGLLSEAWLKEMVAAIRAGDEKKKDQLPYICPHYAAFSHNHRAQKDIIPEAFTFMTCVDVDDKALVEQAIERALQLNDDAYSDWQEQVLRIEYSARRKVHIYIRIPKGKTIEEAQRAFCKEIEVPFDESCITPERFIYVTGRDEEVYRSPHWLETMSDEELEERREAYLERGLDVAGRKLNTNTDLTDRTDKTNTNLTDDTDEKTTTNFANLTNKGVKENSCHSCNSLLEKSPSCSVPVDERVRFIAQGVMKEKGLEESDFLDEGGRHTTVKVFLTGATQLLTKQEMNGMLSELMPDHWQDQNIQQLVSDFYQNYTNPNQRLLKYQEQLFAQSRRLINSKLSSQCHTLEERTLNSQQISPPAMPEKKPKLIQLLLSKTPKIYQPAVANAVFPPLGTHLCGVRFQYTDNVEHEATLMNCLMAMTGAGKGCIDEPIRHIMADIKRRDEENERREAEWKKDCQKRGANKDKLVRPEGLVIQIIDPDMTKPALVTRMDEAEGHFVYVKLNELDLFEQLKGQTGKQHFQLMCLAFDPGAEYGQTRIGTQSVTARPECRFNWNACTTILKGRRFFSRVLTDGPISRINFCTIPETEIGAEQPIYGQYDSAFDEALKPYIDNLVAARGLVDCPQAFKLAKRLQQECAEFARLSQSEVYWNLSHRACVIAWLKACVLYVANGQKWEKAIEDFVRWSLNYDLWCKMQFFGADIDKAMNGDGDRIGTRGPRNLLELLNDEFSIEDAKRVRQQQGLDIRRTYSMIHNWKSRGYIYQLSDISFQKSDKYKSNSTFASCRS